MSDASPTTLVLPAPIAPVMTSNDFVMLPLMFKDAMRSEVGAMGYFKVPRGLLTRSVNQDLETN